MANQQNEKIDEHVQEQDENNLEEDEEVDDLPMEFNEDEYDIVDADELINKLETLEDGEETTLTAEEANQEGLVNESLAVFSGHTDSVLAVAFNKQNWPQVATGGVDDKCFLFNIKENGIEEEGEGVDKEEDEEQVEEPADLYTLQGFNDSIVDVAFSASGRFLAVASYDGEVKIYNTSGKLLLTLSGPTDVEYITWHPKGEILTAGGGDGTIYVWGIPSGTIINVLAGHVDAVTCGAFNYKGNIYVSGSMDGSVKVWKIKTGECLYTFKPDTYNWHEDGIVSLAINPDAPVLISGSRDGTVCISNLKSYKVIVKYNHIKPDVNCSVETCGFCSVCNWVASGGMDGTLKIYDIETSKLRQTLEHDGGITKLIWHPFSPIIFVACLDGCIYVWDARTGEKLKQIRAHNDIILDMDIYVPPTDLKTTYILTGSDDKTCQLFSA